MNESKNKSIKPWIIVLGCMLIQAVPFGVASNIQPQFVGPIVEKYGFSLGAFSLTFTIGTFASAIASPFIGKLFSKISSKTIFIVGSIMSAGGVFVMGIANALPMFYVGYSITQIGTAAISSIGVPVLITAWFNNTTKGKALGIAFAGGSIGNIFLQQIAVRQIASVGPSQAYINFAIASLVVGVLISLLIIDMPKEGEHPSDEVVKSDGEKTEAKGIPSDFGYTFNEVKSMKEYWIYAVGFIFIGIYVSALAMQYSAYLGAVGFDYKILGTVGTVFAIFSLGGNLLGGAIFDKIGMIKGMLIGGILAVIACVSLLAAPAAPMLAYLYGAAKGLSVFAYIIAPSYLTGSLFGKKDFGTILAITNVFFALGFAAGSSVFGFIVDGAGYIVAWGVILGCIVLGYAMILYAIKNVMNINNKKLGKQ